MILPGSSRILRDAARRVVKAPHAALARRSRHNRSIQKLVDRIGSYIDPHVGLLIARNLVAHGIAHSVIPDPRQNALMFATVKLHMP
jgi:hypothetical protein